MPLRLISTLSLSTLVALGLCTATVFGQAGANDEGTRFFETKIRPVLVDQCTKCHGADKQKGGLRLDSKTAFLAGGETGPAVVAGKPDESLLVQALKHDADGPKMPPSKKLPAPVIADFTRWVEMGSPWPGEGSAPAATTARKGEMQITDKDRNHWAFLPIKRSPVPSVKDQKWVKNPIDAFVLAGLEAKGMTPNTPASKLELLRRATYDLTGLPPTIAEVDAFLVENSPNAYEKLVDRLLASPHYGEKWGRHWLDLVRFGETNSYERDNPKPNAWRYRDYVIHAFNEDKPFDRFVREQLAGDELPNKTNDAIVATGYYRLGIWDDEPADRELARYDGLDDIVATTSQVFLGMTVDCARCHDHKIDPIPQKDYYRLLSFFQNVNHYRNGGPTDEVALYTSDSDRLVETDRQKSLDKRRTEVLSEIYTIQREFLAKTGKLGRDTNAKPDLQELTYKFYRDTWEKLPDFALLKPETVGSIPDSYFDIALRSRDEAFGFVFEGFLVVPEDGRYTFYLDSDDGSRLSVNGKELLLYDGIHGEGKEKTAVVSLSKGRVPIKLEYFQKTAGLGLTVGWSGPNFARRPLSTNKADEALAKQARPRNVERQIQAAGARILGAEKFNQYQSLRKELEAVRRDALPANRALCVTENGPNPPETHVLLRGNPQSKGDVVQPAFLTVLGGTVPMIPTPSPDAKSSGRRTALAEWIVARDNPLTPRVLANRIWQHHFGRGIVRSSNNFGTQGDKPTHPELLDWLASELLSNGWHLKPLHKMIMMSNAYQMSSRGRVDLVASDPMNDRLWRFDMRRLSAEEIRDSILSVTGTLNPKMSGPGIYPTIPAEVLAGQSVPGAGWGKSSPEEEARRSVYIHVKRSLLTPILESFDSAETDRSSPNRFVTTQPTQALAMLNSAFLNKEADLLAARLKREAGDDLGKQVALALKLTTSRTPNADEIKRGETLIADLRTKGFDAPTALRSFCLVALNLNEFLYVD